MSAKRRKFYEILEAEERAEKLELDVTDARLLLSEALVLLKHTSCIDGDATKCRACSLEARIEALL